MMTPKYSLTAIAMLAFAANSILCRMALDHAAIDAASFTGIRLLSGAIVLLLIVIYRNGRLRQAKFNPVSSLMLFTYAIAFSFAYIGLSTGTGALILFGSVQLTMILYGLVKGERPGKLVWTGIISAFAGLTYLLLPSVSAPPLANALLMITAGIAWGVYSLRGKGVKNPISATAINFTGTLPMMVLAFMILSPQVNLSLEGIVLAILSGAVASGLGYAIWYSALTHLQPTTAATVQLSVPVIAALAGVALMAEPITIRLLISGIVVLGGIYLTIRPVSTK